MSWKSKSLRRGAMWLSSLVQRMAIAERRQWLMNLAATLRRQTWLGREPVQEEGAGQGSFGLFRNEALRHASRTETIGPVLITTPPQLVIFAWIAGSTALLLMILAATVTLPRTVELRGYLEGGVITVPSQGAGILRRLNVQPGHQVSEHDILFKIEQDGSEEAGGSSQSPDEAIIDAETMVSRRKTRLDDVRKLKEEEALATSLDVEQAVDLLSAAKDELTRIRMMYGRAPADGRVTIVNYENGHVVSSGSEIVRVLPDDSKLIARFLARSTAMGLIAEQQTVQMKFDAFPYQKFGGQTGVIMSISRTAISATDQSAALASEENAGEPLFLIEAELEQDHIDVGDEEYPLSPDMTLTGSVMLERRTIVEWFLEPLLTMRAKL